MTTLTLALSACQTTRITEVSQPQGVVCTVALGGEYAFCKDTRGGETYQVPIQAMEKYKAISYEFWYELLVYINHLKNK